MSTHINTYTLQHNGSHGTIKVGRAFLGTKPGPTDNGLHLCVEQDTWGERPPLGSSVRKFSGTVHLLPHQAQNLIDVLTEQLADITRQADEAAKAEAAEAAAQKERERTASERLDLSLRAATTDGRRRQGVAAQIDRLRTSLDCAERLLNGTV